MFYCKRLSQDGSSLSDYEETTLEKLRELLHPEDFRTVEMLGPDEGAEVEDARGTRYYVHRSG